MQAVVGTERTDIAAAIRLGAAAFPETGQKRLVLLSDGNENTGDAMTALLAARDLGVTVDVVPMGTARGNDVSVQKFSLPPKLKQGQVFEGKITIQADQPGKAVMYVNRDDKLIGQQEVELSAGKNLFTFPDTLPDPGFYKYDVRVEAPGDTVPQNNRASAFAVVRGEPEILVVSSDPEADRPLAAALQSGKLKTKLVGLSGFPQTLAEMQSYDAIFICNVAAGDLGRNLQNLLESAVRDFGVGLVCVGGDQTYAAGVITGARHWRRLCPSTWNWTARRCCPRARWRWSCTAWNSATATRSRGIARWACCRRWGRRTKWAWCCGTGPSTGCFP